MSAEPMALVQWERPIEEPTGDLLVKSRLYNALLHDAIKESGLTQKEYAESVGVTLNTIGGYLTLRICPWSKSGEPRHDAQLLAIRLEIPFNELFPPSLYALRQMVPPQFLLRRYESAVLVPLIEARNVPALENSSQSISEEELREGLRKVLSCLTSREELVLKQKFGLDGNVCSYREIGEQLNLSRERIRQIEAKALRKLRYDPNHFKYLKAFLSTKTLKRYVHMNPP